MAAVRPIHSPAVPEITDDRSLRRTIVVMATPVNPRRDRRGGDRRGPLARRRGDRQLTFKPRVLLIEPHDDTRVLYTVLFEDAGYGVYPVANGADALSIARHRLPDLVIMEVAIPGRDGFAILKGLREDPATADIPAIVVTATLHYDVPVRARESGATVVFTKPTPPDALLIAADEILDATPLPRLKRRQLRRALLTIVKLGSQMKVDEQARTRVRSLIDRLQVAILAMDNDGRYVAASLGAESLTGYRRAELLTMSISDVFFDVNFPPLEGAGDCLAVQSDGPPATLQPKDGTVVAVDAVVATILPGLHAAAFDFAAGG